MNCTYEKLSPTFSQELWELLDEAETLGIAPKMLEALFIAPLISNHIAEAETVAGQRLDILHTARNYAFSKVWKRGVSKVSNSDL